MIDYRILSHYDEALRILESERVRLRKKSNRTKKEVEFLDEIEKRINERASLESKKLLKELTRAIKESHADY